jgi:hypothetical protein
MWVGVLPAAVVPLWQDAHVPMTSAWSTFAGIHAVETWQLSQLFVLLICPTLFPVAAVPLWQLEQVPVTAL